MPSQIALYSAIMIISCASINGIDGFKQSIRNIKTYDGTKAISKF